MSCLSVWQTANHVLIDMKIEFGVLSDGTIVVADVIDNDSWRLWPEGDKKLMLDKQVYREMDNKDIDEKAIDTIRHNFQVVAQRTQHLFSNVIPKARPTAPPVVAIVLGSVRDRPFADAIVAHLSQKYAINDVRIDITSAHKSTDKTLNVCARIRQWPELKVVIACAGMSNGLGPVIAGNVSVPVLNCPPVESLDALSLDIWSSVRMPSGMGCSTVIGADNGALCAARIVGVGDAFVWGRMRCQQTMNALL